MGECCERALDEKQVIDQRLEEAGLQSNVFLSTLDFAKQKAAKAAVSMYLHKHYWAGKGIVKGEGHGRKVQYKGTSYKALQKELHALQVHARANARERRGEP